MIPDFITHYYLPDRKPFLNLSDLTKEEMEPIVEGLNLRAKEGKTHRGFPDWYFPQREEAEINLRKAYIKKGEYPIRKSPHYFYLGRSKGIEYTYKDDFKMIKIPIALIKTKMYFTIGDSLFTFSKQYKEGWYWENQWFQGKLFEYDELIEVVKKIELDFNIRESIQHCVETYLWSDEELKILLKDINYK